MDCLIGASFYRRRDAPTGSEFGGALLQHIPKRTSVFFFVCVCVRAF